MSLSNCSFLFGAQAIARVSVDSAAPSGNDYLTVESSSDGITWTLVDQTGGINPVSTPFTYNEPLGPYVGGQTFFIRFRQFDVNDVQVDEQVCSDTAPNIGPVAPQGTTYCGRDISGLPAIHVTSQYGQDYWQPTGFPYDD